ncbi:hypothetical protein SLEP1_g42851 [Rubroshorea leprosula]|uniref:Uncharacterized protein n=1 Tax=Rubroshorea leprosula TaxID=152421 RepID=A0AAV5LB65_9ROSI|nr:hypothetical protein SLEP1_g42851 [Rubroshorea leprosula]
MEKSTNTKSAFLHSDEDDVVKSCLPLPLPSFCFDWLLLCFWGNKRGHVNKSRPCHKKSSSHQTMSGLTCTKSDRNLKLAIFSKDEFLLPGSCLFTFISFQNSSDEALPLNESIEFLKSLQLQVQVCSSLDFIL